MAMMENRIGNRDAGKGSDLFSRERTLALGRQLSAHVEQQRKSDDDPVVSECRLGQALARNSDVEARVTVNVADNRQVNAVALPGGFVFILTDLRSKANNEAEVAG
jgi:predicted Zn-dependent protease